MSEIHIRMAHWHGSDQPALCQIRQRVFMDEQGVTPELEWDAHDAGATHFLVEADGQPIGCARLLPDGHIGRVAVLTHWRARGIGARLMQAVILEAEARGLRCQQLSAQTHALDFYRRLGFRVTSAEYLDAGIPHVDMQRDSQQP